MLAAAASATQRSGRIRLPTTSERWPTAIRPSAPATWATATTAPAAAGDQSRSWTSQTRAKVHTRNCGITSSTETPWIRARKESWR